jgi:phage shock protein C
MKEFCKFGETYASIITYTLITVRNKEVTMENKKLYRSRTDRMLGGVCGGLGEYLGLDSTIVRLIFVILLLTGTAGFWIYLILLVVIPEEPANSGDVIDVSSKDRD